MNLHRLGPELQRRKVWRTAVAYARLMQRLEVKWQEVNAVPEGVAG
jgi:hypothetical protein